VLGATGTIGRATVAALVRRGHDVVCLSRGALDENDRSASFDSLSIRRVDFSDPVSVARCGFADEHFDAVISCMASRTGAPKDAWAVDYQAHVHALMAAKANGVGHFILLSAICVQKPKLAFQHAKLAFEAELVGSGLRYSIVRPTAYFKSLAGQIERVRSGRSFFIFGGGELTACKPISDADLADFLADCLVDEDRWNRILPIGGPGSPITPREQGEALFRLAGRSPRFRSVPIAVLDMMISVLGGLGRLVPSLADKAELARIGRYYATESMLVWEPQTGNYSADATPSTGSDTLFDYYQSVFTGKAGPERGEHSVF
jgi:divinyl chlorophyllide a 8-vinyl-reductase